MDRRLFLTAAAGAFISACTVLEPPSGDPDSGPGPDRSRSPGSTDTAATVRSSEDLLGALDEADSGDTVEIASDATIDLQGQWGIEVPRDVTLSGGRQPEGSNGAVIRSPPGDEAPRNSDIHAKFILRDGARLTGIRLQGHHNEYVNPAIAYGGDFYAHRGGGVRAGPNTAVENCEISGWPYAGVVALGDALVRDNFIHHNTWEGLGYGVAIPPGDHMPVVEFNDFNYNRHAISAGGGPRVGYVARYNVVGPDWVGSQFDMHGSNGMTGIAGSRIEIHNNTFQGTHAVEAKTRNPGGAYPAIHIRGTPTEGVWVTENWFYHDSRSSAFRQPNGPKRVHFENNHYGINEPEKFSIGAPRSHL